MNTPQSSSHLQRIPLKLLTVSPGNVRRTLTGIEALAASIAAHGLVHNLVAEKVNGHYEVIAGSRRLAALQTLARSGHLPADLEEVRTLVVPGGSAAELSLAENAMREQMDPIDQAAAFKDLLDAGMPEVDVAHRFGVTSRYLRQRMKLAVLSPKVVEAYRAGNLTLEKVEAFTLSDDHSAQDAVLRRISNWTDADEIRCELESDGIDATDKRVRFVGLDAYTAAGGALSDGDLFQEGGEQILVDEKLLDSLVAAKLDESAAKLRKEGWSFVEVGPSIDTYRFTKVQGKAADCDKATTGALVTIGHAGKVEILKGVLKPGQTAVRDESGKVTGATAAAQAKGDPAKLSAAATVRLQGFRTAVLRCEVRKNPRFALAALAAALAAQDLLHSHDGVDRVVRISRGTSMGVLYASTEGTSFQEQDDAEAMWLDRLPDSEGNVLTWLLDNPEQMTIDLLAFLSSRAIAEGQLDVEPGREFAALAGINMAEHWKVTPEWLAQQPTGYLVAAVAEFQGKEAGELTAKQKGKSGVVAHAFNMLEDRHDRTWIPEPMRAPTPVAPKASAKKSARAKPGK